MKSIPSGDGDIARIFRPAVCPGVELDRIDDRVDAK